MTFILNWILSACQHQRDARFDCPYCASQIIDKGFSRRDPLDVVEEIEYWTPATVLKILLFMMMHS